MIGALSITLLVPAFGLLWGALFLDEHVTFSTAAGLVIILAGVILVTRRVPQQVTLLTSGSVL
jgi:drug/metabolite transporter (DMT)-like permease